MEDPVIEHAIHELVNGSPDQRRLAGLYEKLLTPEGEHVVARYALAHILGDLLEYLELVGEEFEKSVGLTQQNERERILGELSPPSGETPEEQVGDIVVQWERVERYSRDDVLVDLEVQQVNE